MRVVVLKESFQNPLSLATLFLIGQGGTFVALGVPGVALGTHHALALRTRVPHRDPEVSDAWLHTNATHPAVHATTVEQRATLLSRRRLL